MSNYRQLYLDKRDECSYYEYPFIFAKEILDEILQIAFLGCVTEQFNDRKLLEYNA